MTSIGSWDPKLETNKQSAEIKLSDLEHFLAIEDKQLVSLADALNQDVIIQQRALMTLHKNAWAQVSSELSNEQLTHLIRFFTLAEAQLSGWEAGSKSPVVWLCRELKKRGAFPDQELIQWIKANTENKFLPYGNPLDF